jgi:hypothetical protein
MRLIMATKPILITLTEEELEQASSEATRRQSANEALGLRGRNGGPSSGAKAYNIHLLGAMGEMAVASYLNLKQYLFLDQKPRRDSDDLPGIDVKTRSRHHYDLIVQKNENPSKKFVLVTIQDDEIAIRGWCYGADAMVEDFWADPARGRPAYFVPQSKLRPIETIQ